MCGIFGAFTNSQNAAEMTFAGLKDIEYRGYDSWGIAYLNNSSLQIKKNIGFLPQKLNLPKSKLAISHTRWATHGGVTVQNSHPHTDCSKKISLVHNGITENFLELKSSLKNHQFLSETDSEVIAHLIENQLKTEPDFTKAVALVFNKLKGLNAIVVTNGREIVAEKVGSPLVVAKLKDGYAIASDPNALLPYSNELLFLEDGNLVNLSTEFRLWDVKNFQQLNPRFTKVSWQHSKSDLKQFKHFMIKEIFEQPNVIRQISLNIENARKAAELIKKAYGAYFIACGTASYACLLGTYLFSKYSTRHVNFAVGSEFNYLEDFLTDKSLVVAVSQSGESIDVLEPVSSVKKKGVKIVSLVNVLGSSLFRLSDFPLLLSAGVEKAVASTKAMIAMVSYMILLSLTVSDQEKLATKILEKSAVETEKLLADLSYIKKIAGKLAKSKNIYVIGRGFSYPVALETALKIKEISYIHAEGFAGGEMKHGAIALIEKNTPVLVFAPDDDTYQAAISNAMEVKARGALVIGVGFKNNPVFNEFIEIADTGAGSVIPHIVVGQLLAYFITLKLKLDPDKPRNLAKSVVVR